MVENVIMPLADDQAIPTMKKQIRNPSELFELFVQHESSDTFDAFINDLSYEELTMIMMITEVMLKNPSITPQKQEMLRVGLGVFKNARKKFLELN